MASTATLKRAAGTASQTSGRKSMSASGLTLEPCKLSCRSNRRRFGRRLGLGVALIVLAIPLSGCGTGALWDKFFAKDETFKDEPADKLYNEGLYLLNQKKDLKAGLEEIRGSRPRASLFGVGAQIAADVGLLLLRRRRLRQLHRRRHPIRHLAPRQPRRGLCAISDRGLALRPDPGRNARSGPHRKGHRRAGRGDSQISDLGILPSAPRPSSKVPATSSPATK